jgi:uncharacterized membrane protein YecN with MAPEG domain
MTLVAAPLYTSLLALVFVVLSMRVIRLRRSERIAVGHGESKPLMRAMRVQANFAEYVPLALILLGYLEIQQLPVYLVHVFGLTLVVGRLAHAYGMSQTPEDFRFRVWGMYATFFVLAGQALVLIGSLALRH